MKLIFYLVVCVLLTSTPTPTPTPTPTLNLPLTIMTKIMLYLMCACPVAPYVSFLALTQQRSHDIYIYIYAFSRRFYPKRLTLHSSYSFTFYQLLMKCSHEALTTSQVGNRKFPIAREDSREALSLSTLECISLLTLWFIILSLLGRGNTRPSHNILLYRSIAFATQICSRNHAACFISSTLRSS